MTTKIGNLVDVSTIREIVSLAKDTITRSDAGRIAVLPPAEYIVGNLENAGSKD